jgi:hypothetical protein
VCTTSACQLREWIGMRALRVWLSLTRTLPSPSLRKWKADKSFYCFVESGLTHWIKFCLSAAPSIGPVVRTRGRSRSPLVVLLLILQKMQGCRHFVCCMLASGSNSLLYFVVGSCVPLAIAHSSCLRVSVFSELYLYKANKLCESSCGLAPFILCLFDESFVVNIHFVPADEGVFP